MKTSHEKEPWPLSGEFYKLDGPIGNGRFGIVWRAHCFKPNSTHHLKKVAIKILDLSSQQSQIEDFRKEISIMGSNFHKNLLNQFCSFTHERELWLVMPLLEGSLNDIVAIQKGEHGIKDEVLLASIL